MNRKKKKREQYAEQAEMDRRSKAKYGKLVGSWNKAPGQSGWSKVEDDKMHLIGAAQIGEDVPEQVVGNDDVVLLG